MPTKTGDAIKKHLDEIVEEWASKTNPELHESTKVTKKDLHRI